MKIWEEEEFLNIRNFIFFLIYIVELIILLLVNFILKNDSRIVQIYIHISKTGINISLHNIINLNVLRKFKILCWATLIAVQGRMWPSGHWLDSHVWIITEIQKFGWFLKCCFLFSFSKYLAIISRDLIIKLICLEKKRYKAKSVNRL